MSSPANPLAPSSHPPYFLADLYTFHWSEFNLRLPLVSALGVALCLFGGILLGHPGGALVAGGGALTIGFGANQRITDSRLMPMIAAVFSMSSATLIGTLAGHKGYALVLAATISAFIYGVLTARHAGLAWVGQQASVALLVASAFPTGPRPAFERAGLIVLGGTVQIVVTSLGLSLMPDLRKDLLRLPGSLYTGVQQQRRELLFRLHGLPNALPALSHSATLAYCTRLALTIGIATELYHQMGVPSGYWIPMTALLVQKPAFFETLTRTSARILGTLLGAWLCSLLIAHIAPQPLSIAAWTTFFAFASFATNAVNYGLFTACITAYIVFLLSLNQLLGSVIAHRRAWCTILGGLVALLIHLDALRRHRAIPVNS